MRQSVNIMTAITALILSAGTALANTGEFKNSIEADEKTQAVYISYSKPNAIYKKAHKACGKFFARGIASERTSYSVEILNVVPKIRRASALCVTRTYKNDDVTKVAEAR